MNQNRQAELKHLIILTELTEKDRLKELVIFLTQKTGLTKDRIRKLLTDTPRVITTVNNLNEAKSYRTEIEKFGCRVEIEALFSNLDVDMPFQCYRNLKKELSRVLRSKISLTLIYVDVCPTDTDQLLPSMMGIDKELEKFFRESDTVYPLDDNRFILLGFSTNQNGAENLKNKTIQALYKLINKQIRIIIGYSVLPDQVRTITELISVANDSRIIIDNENYESVQNNSPVKNTKTGTNVSDSQNEISTIQLYFNKARGRLLRRFFTLDAHELWSGLSKLPKANQNAFLYRLPYDFEMAPTLEKIIQVQPEHVEMAAETKSRLQEIIYSIDLENSLAERYKIQDDILVKLNNTDALPVLPHVAQNVISIISDPESNIERLTDVIKTDATLTIKILQLVNSSFYGYPQKINSVKEAIVILGNDEVLNVALGLAVAKMLSSSSLDGCCNPEVLWCHSIGTAMIAQHISKQIPDLKDKPVFTAGLLHDFGKIFMMNNFPELYRRIHLDALKYELPLYEIEEEICNINHAKVGEIIAAKWNLPSDLVLSIAKHHQFLKKDVTSGIAAIVSLADYLYHKANVSDTSIDVASSLTHKLTYGHFSILKEMFEDFNADKLEEMVEEAAIVLQENKDIFALA